MFKSNNRKVIEFLFVCIVLGATATAKADYWDYRYIGNPANTVQTTDPDTVFAGGRVTVDFHSSVLLDPNQTFWLGATSSISNIVINFDYTGGLNPAISHTFNGYPDATLDPYYSYITIGNDAQTIVGWEIDKSFRAITSPHPGAVITAGYLPGWDESLSYKPYCVLDCTAFDRILLDDASVWVYNNPGTWTVTFVPESETYAMLMAGLGILGAVARRRKQKAA